MSNIRCPWWSPQMTGREVALIQEVLESNFLNEGEIASRFEREVASRVGAKYGVSVTSGTTAIYLSLMGLGIGPGDEVLVPDITFIATANAVSMTGATPVLVDVDPMRLTMDVAAAEGAITSNTKAIVPVHVSGRSAAMDELLELGSHRGLPIVEDAAEALGSQRGGHYLGTMGVTGCFSFSAAKMITTGQGGMIVTNDKGMEARLRELKDQGRPKRGTGGDDLHPTLGFNFKFTNLQAAVGLGQLQSLSARLVRMRQIYLLYCESLRGLEEITLLPFDIEDGEQPLWVDALVERRMELDAFLASKGAECRRFWFPLHSQGPYRRDSRHYAHSSHASEKAIWLPSAFQMTDDDVRWVAGLIREFYGK